MSIALNLQSYFGAVGSPYDVRRRCEPLSSWLYDYGYPDLALVCAKANNVDDLKPHYHALDDILCGWQNKFADLQSISSNPNRRRLYYHPMAFHVPSDEGSRVVSELDAKKSFLRERCHHYLGRGENYLFLQDLKSFLVRRSRAQECLARLDGYVMETVGFEDGLRGHILNPRTDVLLTSNGRSVGKSLGSAFCLLGLMRSRTAGVRCMAGETASRVADAFMEGVEHHLPDAPNSFRVLSRQWAKVNRFQLYDNDVQLFSRSVGIYAARILYSQFILAKAMGLQWTTVKRRMHQVNITEFVYAMGWLQGYMEFLGAQSDEEWIGVLDKNIRSVIAGAIVTNDIRYAYLLTRGFPRILEHFRRDEAEVKATYRKKQEWRLPYDGTELSQALLQGGALKYLD